jgi:hypothetical protein
MGDDNYKFIAGVVVLAGLWYLYSKKDEQSQPQQMEPQPMAPQQMEPQVIVSPTGQPQTPLVASSRRWY